MAYLPVISDLWLIFTLLFLKLNFLENSYKYMKSLRLDLNVILAFNSSKINQCTVFLLLLNYSNCRNPFLALNVY